jgi:hypothetical protein
VPLLPLLLLMPALACQAVQPTLRAPSSPSCCCCISTSRLSCCCSSSSLNRSSPAILQHTGGMAPLVDALMHILLLQATVAWLDYNPLRTTSAMLVINNTDQQQPMLNDANSEALLVSNIIHCAHEPTAACCTG